MTGIEKLRDVCKALKYSPWCGTDIATIGGEPAYEKLRKIADQIEREIDEAVADEVADTLSAYEMNTNARWHSAVVDGAESDCKAEFELISRYWLPRPRFEDGEPVQFGDRFVANTGEVRQVARITCLDDGRSVLISEYGHRYIVGKEKADGERIKRPEPPKVLDADGVEIKVGDEVWDVESGDGPWIVGRIDGERVTCASDDLKCYRYANCIMFTHKRPEPEDSWERIEADVANGDACHYFGHGDDESCNGCHVFEKSAKGPLSCGELMAFDVLRRCKKFAGVE